jgi:hypothetical protein
MKLSRTQRHALYLMINNGESGVFQFIHHDRYAAHNTLEALMRRKLVVQLLPGLLAVTKGGRAEARNMDAQESLPLGSTEAA